MQKNPAFLNQFSAQAQKGLIEITARVVSRRSRSATQTQYRRHFLDFLLIVFLLLVGAALWRDYIAEDQRVFVARPSGLLPFHVIVPTDLRLAGHEKNPGDSVRDFIGRYSMEYIAQGDSVTLKRLNSGPRVNTELNNRSLVRLKVQATALFSGMKPPFKATLVAAPHERGAGALILDVFVLDLQKEGDGLSTVLAIPSTDESILAGFIGRSDFFLVARLL
jgi:hypothetical protein